MIAVIRRNIEWILLEFGKRNKFFSHKKSVRCSITHCRYLNSIECIDGSAVYALWSHADNDTSAITSVIKICRISSSSRCEITMIS